MDNLQSIVPEMIYIPKGYLKRGSDSNDEIAFPDEYTSVRFLEIDGFYVSKFPITNQNYKKFVLAKGYRNSAWWGPEGWKWVQNENSRANTLIDYWIYYLQWLKERDLSKLCKERQWRKERMKMYKELTSLSRERIFKISCDIFSRSTSEPAFWNDELFNQDDQPVVGINWYEANAYCKWLSSVTGKNFRLLNEMEWEYVARGEDGRIYPWGNEFNPLLCNTIESKYHRTTVVYKYPGGVSPFGVYDISGNVWEWTSDLYKSYQGNNLSYDEFIGCLPLDIANQLFIVRGGSWDNNYRFARCASRDKDFIEIFANRLGFRIAF